MNNTARCHGHDIETSGVPHVCTDLCTVNACCKPDPATMTPPEVDTVLADLWTRRAQARMYLDSAISIGDRYPHQRDDARIEGLRAEASALTAQARPYEAQFAARRWSRFFIVRNNGGHIHSSMDCPTCYPTTQFGWLPQLSGLSEADAVADQGEILCSICFPSAPVAWTSGTSRADKEAKAERTAAKAARDAKKLEKALLPDGSDLVVAIEVPRHDGGTHVRRERFSTLHQAKVWLTDAAERPGSYYPEHARQAVAEAVAAKTGETVEEVFAAAKKRAANRS